MPDKDLTRFTGLNELGVTSWITYDWFKFQLARTPPSVQTLECNCKFRFCSCENTVLLPINLVDCKVSGLDIQGTNSS